MIYSGQIFMLRHYDSEEELRKMGVKNPQWFMKQQMLEDRDINKGMSWFPVSLILIPVFVFCVLTILMFVL